MTSRTLKTSVCHSMKLFKTARVRVSSLNTLRSCFFCAGKPTQELSFFTPSAVQTREFHHHSMNDSHNKVSSSTTRNWSLRLNSASDHCVLPFALQSSAFSTSPRSTQSSKSKSSGFEFFSIRSLFSTPMPYLAYGLGGLVPFMAAPAYMQMAGLYIPWVAEAQLVYGACILSFLGGVSWGSHLSTKAREASLSSLQYSILLPLVAWPAVLLYPNVGSFALMISGIVYAGLKDTQNSFYPLWFRNLRFLLTVLVATSLLTTAVFKFTKDTKKKESISESEKGESIPEAEVKQN